MMIYDFLNSLPFTHRCVQADGILHTAAIQDFTLVYVFANL